MAGTTIKGRGVVRNAAGTVTIAGVAQINTAQNAEIVDASEVQMVKDALGLVQTLVVAETIKKVTCELIPGGNSATDATLAQAVAESAMPTKLGNLNLSGFTIGDYNGTYVIVEDSPVKMVAGGNATVTVKGTKFERDFSAAAITV